jgi:hypothetical protein
MFTTYSQCPRPAVDPRESLTFGSAASGFIHELEPNSETKGSFYREYLLRGDTKLPKMLVGNWLRIRSASGGEARWNTEIDPLAKYFRSKRCVATASIANHGFYRRRQLGPLPNNSIPTRVFRALEVPEGCSTGLGSEAAAPKSLAVLGTSAHHYGAPSPRRRDSKGSVHPLGPQASARQVGPKPY